MNSPAVSADISGTVSAELQETLCDSIRGGVSFDPVIRGIHATDASHYQITPACVVTPRDETDVVAALEAAAAFQMPITPRGGATALSGQTFGPGMVLDLSRHLTGILEINAEERWARVEAGVVRDQLNHALKPHGLQFAPDPATTSRATIGGMVGNNSAGMRSIVYGKTIDHILECKIALADGTVIRCASHDETEWQERASGKGRRADIYRGVESLITANREEILRRYPKVMRRVSGYNLDEFVDGAGYTGPIGPRDNAGHRLWNLGNLIVGSEGTLATLLEARVRLVPLPAAMVLCVVHFDDEIAALRAVAPINAHGPSAVELIDRGILREAQTNAATKKLTGWIEGDPAAVLLVEFSGEPEEAADRTQKLIAALQAEKVGYAYVQLLDEVSQNKAWETRRMGLGLLSNRRGAAKGLACVEDACLPIEVLPEYIEKLQAKCKSLEVETTMYAHASVGVIHFRPVLDLHLEADRQRMHEITDAAFELTVSYGGAFAGEHGDGQLRGEFVPRFFGPQLYEAFRQVKGLFDPENRMNPGKIVDAPSMIDPATLRYGTYYQTPEIPTEFRYGEQGGFRLAVEQCNGVGACRKLDAGTMCPSYMATREEQDSTRGRANALRLAMSGQLSLPDAVDTDPLAAIGSDGVHDVLELCLSCKACKTECPNAVDMARLKSEAQQMRHDRHGVPLSAKLFGGFPDQARRFSGLSGRLANFGMKLPGVGRLLKRIAGVDPRRSLPEFAGKSLTKLLAERESRTSSPQTPKAPRGRVVLFDDTFASYLEPNIGLAAVELLESLGYEVTLANAGCCQRPRLSVGLVREAKEYGGKTIENLDAFAREGLPILCLEPSCASALADDLPDLVENREAAARVAGQVQLLETFLVAEGVQLACEAEELLLHGHCHQKALFGTESLHQLFANIDGVNLQEVDSGCCGMAGSFGYTHYDLSEKIGEDRLFPAVRDATAASKIILAPGTSCRQQLKDFLNVDAQHWVEVVHCEDAKAPNPAAVPAR